MALFHAYKETHFLLSDISDWTVDDLQREQRSTCDGEIGTLYHQNDIAKMKGYKEMFVVLLYFL